MGSLLAEQAGEQRRERLQSARAHTRGRRELTFRHLATAGGHLGGVRGPNTTLPGRQVVARTEHCAEDLDV